MYKEAITHGEIGCTPGLTVAFILSDVNMIIKLGVFISNPISKAFK